MAKIEFQSFKNRNDRMHLRVNPGWKKLVFAQAAKRGISASELLIWAFNASVLSNPELMDELAERTREKESATERVEDLQLELS